MSVPIEAKGAQKLDWPERLCVGTSSWSNTDWYGVFYPETLKPAEFITYYAQHFDTVEIDSTFYHAPSRYTVAMWAERTPPGFIFSAKVPRVITHEKYLVDCQDDLNEFVRTMDYLEEKLGPLVLQFPYVAKSKDPEEYRTGDDFYERLSRFLPILPKGPLYAVEVRNSTWLTPRLVELLNSQGVALVLSCFYTLPALDELIERLHVLTGTFTYVRFIGHRYKIESLVKVKIKSGEKKKEWDELVIDRRGEMERWIKGIRELLRHRIDMYVYFNNHYAGHAPGSIRLFHELWEQIQDDPA